MYETKQNRWLKHFDFLLLDIFTMECLYWVLLHLLVTQKQISKKTAYTQMYYLIPIALLVAFILVEIHRQILKRDIWSEIVSVIKINAYLSVVTLAYLFLIKNIDGFSRRFFICFGIFGCVALLAERTVYKSYLIQKYKTTEKKLHVVYITDKDVTEETLREIKGANIRYSLDAVFCNKICAGGNQFPFKIEALESMRNERAVDEAILDIADDKEERIWVQYLISSGVSVHIRLDSSLKHLPNASIERLGNMTVITSSQSVAYAGQLLIKRIMDILGGLVGVIITGIAFLIFAPMIKKQSPGPVFYQQTRIGKNGRQFQIYKFRSMYPDADKRKKELMQKNKMNGHMFKLENDPRIIPIGHFMRKHSIDELPQFINVLKGDMSLVGTRPPTLDEWVKYSAHHRARLGAKPGLTGVWQVSGRSDITNFEEVVAMDVEYIEKWNIWLDMKLIIKTIGVVVAGSGAE